MNLKTISIGMDFNWNLDTLAYIIILLGTARFHFRYVKIGKTSVVRELASKTGQDGGVGVDYRRQSWRQEAAEPLENSKHSPVCPPEFAP